jgi:glycosyltransferase involved in cell wall biosynthesis
MSATHPTLSIIVPVYNSEKYLCNCLDSIAEQSFRDFELILIDDGSADSSGTICDNYAMNDGRIKVIHKENGGASSARNCGIQSASGKYISFVDSDDWLNREMYSVMFAEMQKDDYDIVICGFVMHLEDGENEYPAFDSVCSAREFSKNVLDGGFLNGCLWNKIYKKDIISSFDPEMHLCEDTKFNFDVSKKAAKCRYIPDMLYHYNRANPQSTLNSSSYWGDEFISNHEKFVTLTADDRELNDIAVKELLNSAFVIVDAGIKFGRSYEETEFFSADCLKKYVGKIYFNKHINFRNKIKFMLLRRFKHIYYFAAKRKFR